MNEVPHQVLPEGSGQPNALLAATAALRPVPETAGEPPLFHHAIDDDFPAPVWRADPAGKRDYFNRRWLTFTGWTLAEVMGDGWIQGVHPDDRKRLNENYLAAFHSRDPFELEYRLRVGDGEYRWVADRGHPFTALDGTFAGYIGAIFDITKHKLAEAELKKREAQLAAAQQLAHLGRWDWDLATNEVTLSDELWRIAGIEPQSWVTTYDAALKLLNPDEFSKTDEFIRAEMEAGRDYRMEHRVVRPDGTVRIVSSYSCPVFDEAGRPIRVFGTAQDVTEQKQAEEKLRFQALLLDTVEHSVIAIDLDRKVTYWNRSAEHLFGWSAAEAMGRNVMELTGPIVTHEQGAEIIRTVMAGKVWSGEFVVQRRDGTLVPVQATDSPIRAADGTIVGFVGIAHDITERKRTEERVAWLASFPVRSPNPVIEFDLAADEVRYANPAAARLFPDLQRQGLNHPFLAGLPSAVKSLLDGREAAAHLEVVVGDVCYAQDICYLAEAQRLRVYCTDITQRKKAEDALYELSARLLEAQDEERRRLARELHDSTAQDLMAVGMNLAQLQQRIEGGDPILENLIADSIAILDHCTDQVRTISYLLHPPLLAELGLLGALRHYVTGFVERSGLRVELEATDYFSRLPAAIETTLFRVVQECLVNVHRHSGARSALIRLRRADGQLELEVADDGRGLPPESLSNEIEPARLGVGIPGMRERLRQLDGRLDINSTSTGTIVRAVLPLK